MGSRFLFVLILLAIVIGYFAWSGFYSLYGVGKWWFHDILEMHQPSDLTLIDRDHLHRPCARCKICGRRITYIGGRWTIHY